MVSSIYPSVIFRTATVSLPCIQITRIHLNMRLTVLNRYLVYIGVVPEAQGRGLASQLVNHVAKKVSIILNTFQSGFANCFTLGRSRQGPNVPRVQQGAQQLALPKARLQAHQADHHVPLRDSSSTSHHGPRSSSPPTTTSRSYRVHWPSKTCYPPFIIFLRRRCHSSTRQESCYQYAPYSGIRPKDVLRSIIRE